MSFNFSLYQPYLAVLLPLLMPYLADGLASILSQDGFYPVVNDGLAWAFLLVASVASGIIDNQFLNTPDVAVNAIVSIATLLLAGPLTSLKPWINFSGFLQSRVFSVVKQGASNVTAQEARGQAFNATQVVTPDMLSSLAREITTGLQSLFVQPSAPQTASNWQVTPARSNNTAAPVQGTGNVTPFPVPARPQAPTPIAQQDWPQKIPAVNLATVPITAPQEAPEQPTQPQATPLQGGITRHWGDTNVTAAVVPTGM